MTQPIILVDDRGCIFSVVGAHENMPPRFISSIRAAEVMQIVTIGGGVKGIGADQVAKMLPWVRAGFKGFRGVLLSGGTAYFDKTTGALKADVVTSIPAVLAAEERLIAIGTFPRVENFAIDRQYHYLYTDGWGAIVDPRYHHVAAIQQSASDVLGWDGDLKQRFAVLDMLEDWRQAYLIINGGAVTRDEAYMALKRDMPVIVARGSGREADALILAAEEGDFSLTAKEDRDKAGTDTDKIKKVDAIVDECRAILEGRESLVHPVDFGDGDALYAALNELGFFDETE